MARKPPQVAEHVEEHTEGCLACLSLPASHRKRIRATDGLLERFDQEIKRRTRVVRIFPNREACLRLVAALAVDEQFEEWVSGRRCLNMEELLQAEWEASGVKREEREVAPIIKRR